MTVDVLCSQLVDCIMTGPYHCTEDTLRKVQNLIKELQLQKFDFNSDKGQGLLEIAAGNRKYAVLEKLLPLVDESHYSGYLRIIAETTKIDYQTSKLYCELCASLLISKGADPAAKNEKGESAYELAHDKLSEYMREERATYLEASQLRSPQTSAALVIGPLERTSVVAPSSFCCC